MMSAGMMGSLMRDRCCAWGLLDASNLALGEP